MAHIRDVDLQALVEACTDQGMNFRDTAVEVRKEIGWPDLRITVDTTIHGYRLAEKAGHRRAGEELKLWLERTGHRVRC